MSKFAIIILTIFISVHAVNSFQPTNKNCSYSIEIETTCASYADTTGPIGLRFNDLLGNLIIVKHLKNPKLVYAPKEILKEINGTYHGFRRCAIDKFEVIGTCMSKWVCSLYLKRFGSDGWRPGWVKVLHQENGEGDPLPVSYKFYFRTFVPQNVWFGFDYCHSRRGFIPHFASFSGKT